jgi:hypothetical protein
VQIPAYGLPVVHLADSDSLQPGDPVALVGNPRELEGSITTGIVSGIRSSELGYRVIQTDAAANPGNSGGPLVDDRGRAVGVLCFKLAESENLNFVIPSNYVRGLLGTRSDLSLEAMRTQLAGSTLLSTTSTFPRRWKSLTSGTVKVLRLEGAHLYVETEVTPEQKANGMFSTADLVKRDSLYVGTWRRPHACVMRDGYSGQSWWKWCPAEDSPLTITLFSPTRIEGIGEEFKGEDPNYDCLRCRARGPAEKSTFVWIPE